MTPFDQMVAAITKQHDSEGLAELSTSELAFYYFEDLDGDPDMVRPNTRMTIAEVERRGLSVTQLHDTLQAARRLGVAND